MKGRARKKVELSGSSAQKPAESDSDNDSTDKEILCPECAEHGSGKWVSCDSCSRWYHVACVDVDNLDEISDSEWFCGSCSGL